jgi:hypothetical protein
MCNENKCKWNFPHNGCGQIRGVADAGIQTFTGTEIQSLTREICQNSLDAAVKDSKKPVMVEFKQHDICSSDIPGYNEYKSDIKKGYDFWSNNPEATKVLKKALDSIEKTRAIVLRISDFNTTGLSSPYEEYSNEGWNTLTKLDGGATKTGDKAGSFGIGKNAPFTNSDYRLVFYRTLNEANETAAQGMSRFVSFPEDQNDSINTMTTGIGYYGNPKGNLPVECITELEELYKRTDKGTDVFIYGFNGKEWQNGVINEVLGNFLISIHKNLLSVKIDDKEIDSSTLSSYLKTKTRKNKDAYWYYQVLVSKETNVFLKKFHELGMLKLSVLVDSSQKLNKKILITRSSGMKLFDLDSMKSKPISFSGILEMEGEKLKEFFREMETPAHDKWVPKRHSNEPLAKQYYKELKNWINEQIQTLGEDSSNDKIEVIGLPAVLQKESDETTQNENSNKESLQDTIGSITVQSRTSNNKPKGLFFGSDENGKSKNTDVEGNVSIDGDYPTTRNLNGTRHRRKKDTHMGREKTGGHDTVHKKYGEDIAQKLKNVRIIKISKNVYRVSFILPRNINAGHVEITAVGENGKPNRLKINSASELMGCTGIKNSSEGIKFSSMKGKEKIQFRIALFDNRNYAMEVNVYEHN